MTVELRPLGVTCNIGCQYCYQEPQRDAGNLLTSYDIEAMKAAILQEGGPFSLFGGEPLLVPDDDLERLWSWGFEQFGSNGIQTNGTLLTENHLRMFRQYRVHVGISIDGPGELNDVRWAGSLERTRKATESTERAIERLCKAGIPPSLIVTLHRNNGTSDKMPVLYDWLRYMDGLGVTSVRLHLLEVDSAEVRQKYALSSQENIEALLGLAALEREMVTLRFDLFDDMKRMLRGRDSDNTCVWYGCDPYTTSAVRGVEGNGQRSNCGRTNKEGIDFVKADRQGFERYLALYHTLQEHGGCSGCRFFLMCKGECLGTAIGGDWRNKTEHCDVWKAIFRHLEDGLLDEGVTTLSVDPMRKRVEALLLEDWAAGSNPGVERLLGRVRASETASSASERGNGTTGVGDPLPAINPFSAAHSDGHIDGHSDHGDHGSHGDGVSNTHRDHTDNAGETYHRDSYHNHGDGGLHSDSHSDQHKDNSPPA